MGQDDDEEKLCATTPPERVLLLSQCLRPSQTCPGKFSKQGLECPGDCSQSCAIRCFKEAAVSLGYKGVCVAAGGAMALRFVKEHHPKGIVAVACSKELLEGVQGVQEISNGDIGGPAIAVVPLLKDGCVDTEVDVEQVLRVINAGVQPGVTEKPAVRG